MPAPRALVTLPALALAALLLAGIALRGLPGLPTSFPMGDGGLFAVMASDLQAEGWVLPWFTSYNGGEIPFVYPPLGLYVLAGLSSLLGQSPIEVMDWWAPLLAVASMGAAWLLLTELTDRATGSWATAVFALMPRSFEWLIVGGGVTRTLGFTLALLALWQLAIAVRRRRTTHALAAGLLAGLTLVTHPEASLFGVVSALALVVRERERLGAFARSALPAGAAAALIAAPWLLVTVGRHGWQPYLEALTSHNQGWTAVEHLLSIDTGTPLPIDPAKLVGGLGLVVLVLRRRWFVPTWYAGLMLLITGAGPTYAMLPLGIAVVHGARWLAAFVLPAWRVPLAAGAAAAAVLLAAASLAQPLSPARQLSADTRQTMEWVAEHTSADSRFALVSGRDWWGDTEAEWFPALTGRVSVATVQGTEWLGKDAWQGALAAHAQLQSCAQASLRCLSAWSAAHGLDVDYVWPHGDAALALEAPVVARAGGAIAPWDRQPWSACPRAGSSPVTSNALPAPIDCRDVTVAGVPAQRPAAP